MSVRQAPTRPYPSQPNEFWVNAMFVLTIAGVVVSIAIVLAPAAATALFAFLLVKTTNLKGWWFAFAGLAVAVTLTTQVDLDAGATGRGTVTPEHRFKAEPNFIGRQRDGEITIVSDPRVEHGFVTRTDPGAWRSTASHILAKPVEPVSYLTEEPRETPGVVELR